MVSERKMVTESGQATERKAVTGALQLAFGCRRLGFTGGAKG